MGMVSYTQEQVQTWSSDCWYTSRYSGITTYTFLHTVPALKNQVFYPWKLLVLHVLDLILGNFGSSFLAGNAENCFGVRTGTVLCEKKTGNQSAVKCLKCALPFWKYEPPHWKKKRWKKEGADTRMSFTGIMYVGKLPAGICLVLPLLCQT